MLESNPSESHADGRKPARGLLVSSGLHAAAIGVLVLSHEPVVIAPKPTAAYQRVALLGPPPRLPAIHRSIERPKLDAPRATDGFAKERWVGELPPETVLPKPDLAVAKLVIAVEAPVTDEIVPFESPVQLPEPTVRTGMFEAGESRTAEARAPRQATVMAGFADPATSEYSAGAKLVARVGAFGPALSDQPAHGAEPARQVAPVGFGETPGEQVTPARTTGHSVTAGNLFGISQATKREDRRITEVRATSFGEPNIPTSAPRRRAEPVAAHFDREVEIVSKPRPRYTDEARKLGVEGEVVLEVLFGANGEVRVKRMLRGLGHGLDERAVEAASLISFRPAQRDGKAVDIVATVRIQFQLI